MPKSISLPALELAVGLYDHYESVAQVAHYFGLLAIYGLCRVAEKSADNGALMNRCRAILERFPDQINHARYNFPSYRIGGIPRAWMLFRGHMTDETTRALVAEYAQEMMTAPRDRKGLLSMPSVPEQQKVWIDVAMAATPYLLFAGLAMDRPDWIDEAANQAFLHYEEFLNPSNGLLHQSRGFVGFDQFSTDHWGRGNGWGYIALTELVQYLPADSKHRPRAEKCFKDLSKALLRYQTPRGLWRQEIPDESAWEESSATGLIAYGYGVGVRLGLLDQPTYAPAFTRAIAGLCNHCINDDFSTELCSPGCLCPGEGARKGTPAAYIEDKQPKPDDGHSFGPFILALNESA